MKQKFDNIILGIRFKCDASGLCIEPRLPQNVDDEVIIFNETITAQNTDKRQSLPTLPANGVIMDVVILYDNPFLNDLHRDNIFCGKKLANSICI